MRNGLLRRTVLYLFIVGFAGGFVLPSVSPSVASDCGLISGGPGRCLGCWSKDGCIDWGDICEVNTCNELIGSWSPQCNSGSLNN